MGSLVGFSALGSAVGFIVSLIMSTLIIFVVTKILGEKEGIGTAFLAALGGAIIYSVTYFLLGNGLVAGVIGGIVWLIALGQLYNIGWFKALLIAIGVWVAATVVGFLLPTVVGPL